VVIGGARTWWPCHCGCTRADVRNTGTSTVRTSSRSAASWLRGAASTMDMRFDPTTTTSSAAARGRALSLSPPSRLLAAALLSRGTCTGFNHITGNRRC
jgi:hypothetical protein